jgi:hypothetical protein
LYGVSTHYAMIDNAGNVLTDFRFQPPEYSHRYDRPSKPLDTLRWVGNLAVLSAGSTLGLASADGKILFEPQFRAVGPIHDGMIRVESWDAKGIRIGYLDERGVMIIPQIYSNGTNFENGIAWVTKAWADANRVTHDDGYALIDHQGNVLLSGLYKDPSFIRKPVIDESDPSAYQDIQPYGSGFPNAVGKLFCIANADGFLPYGRPHDWLNRMDWGYVDFSGHKIAWHTAEH